MEYSHRSLTICNFVLTSFYFIIVVITVSTLQSDVQLNFDKPCYNLGDDAVLTATYPGAGTVEYINWYCDKSLAIIDAITCKIFDNWYPNSRLTYTCDSVVHMFSTTITALNNADFGRAWGISLRLSGAETTQIVRNTLPECAVSIYTFFIISLYSVDSC